jgi:enolase
MMIELDGTPNKDRLGANSTLAVSLACARAAAKTQSISLYQYIANLAKTVPSIPVPLMVMIEGGKHGFGNPLTYQEFSVIGHIRHGRDILEQLKTLFTQETVRWNQGSEGGLAPFLPTNESALDLLTSVKGDTDLALDIAASHIKSTGLNLIQTIDKYNLMLVEDPFAENDWSAWTSLTKSVGKTVYVVGDDLITTNIKRLEEAIAKQAANASIIKPNQIGTLSETLEVAKRAKEVDWELVVSHRAGETMDDFITDLAVGLGAKFLKSGSPSQKERLIKYERLSEIEKELKT